MARSAIAHGAGSAEILVVDGDVDDGQRRAIEGDGGRIRLHALRDLTDEPSEAELRAALGPSRAKLCWASKSLFAALLLERALCARVLYFDSDIHVFADIRFLFEALDAHAILLTPHWRPIDPEIDAHQFHCNLRDGLYNAGFIGASRAGVAALRWWHRMCLYRCEKDSAAGLYDDQRYLDLLPIYFENVHVLRHPGCNVAEWNRRQLRRSEEGGQIFIEGAGEGGGPRGPLVFAHFTDLTMDSIDSGEDPLLRAPLAVYRRSLAEARSMVGSV